jgi:hypothetical protein
MKRYLKHIKFFGLAILVAMVMSLFEIQIEGAYGWAAQLPTWRISNIHVPLVGMWYGYRGKPLTGYHLYLILFSFLLLHVAFFYTKWNLKKELNLISFYAFFSTIEGLLWFILNPAWGWHKFREGIPWYKEAWILGLPAEYWLRFGFASVLYYFSQKDADSKNKAD